MHIVIDSCDVNLVRYPVTQVVRHYICKINGGALFTWYCLFGVYLPQLLGTMSFSPPPPNRHRRPHKAAQTHREPLPIFPGSIGQCALVRQWLHSFITKHGLFSHGARAVQTILNHNTVLALCHCGSYVTCHDYLPLSVFVTCLFLQFWEVIVTLVTRPRIYTLCVANLIYIVCVC